MRKLLMVLGLSISIPVHASILAQENFDAQTPGAPLGTLDPNWFSFTSAWRVGNQPGFAASGTQYLSAPSRLGLGSRQLFGWFDASSAWNNRDPGKDNLIASVKMYIPRVTESTYGGMQMFDQAGNSLAVIGVDMLVGKTLTNASNDIANIDVRLGEYNDIELIASFVTGRIDYLFNGSKIGSRQMSAANMAAGFSDFDFYNNGFNATSSVAFRYDDYLVSAVPEPGSLALLAAAGLAFSLAGRSCRKYLHSYRKVASPI